mmetsp:Transcript_120765/g.352723  ORF Transcript_120765/g.352723 Transcript_120765/m.352723 type:complete len:214 (+) Transcript_120765:814-1455(+)
MQSRSLRSEEGWGPGPLDCLCQQWAGERRASVGGGAADLPGPLVHAELSRLPLPVGAAGCRRSSLLHRCRQQPRLVREQVLESSASCPHRQHLVLGLPVPLARLHALQMDLRLVVSEGSAGRAGKRLLARRAQLRHGGVPSTYLAATEAADDLRSTADGSVPCSVLALCVGGAVAGPALRILARLSTSAVFLQEPVVDLPRRSPQSHHCRRRV